MAKKAAAVSKIVVGCKFSKPRLRLPFRPRFAYSVDPDNGALTKLPAAKRCVLKFEPMAVHVARVSYPGEGGRAQVVEREVRSTLVTSDPEEIAYLENRFGAREDADYFILARE